MTEIAVPMREDVLEAVRQLFCYLGYDFRETGQVREYLAYTGAEKDLESSSLNMDQKDAVRYALGLENSFPVPYLCMPDPARARKAARMFGTTWIFRNAGHVLRGGSMLDFSEGQGYRTLDHRAINALYEDENGTGAMIRFMREGNIRISEFGIDLIVPPTARQVQVLKDFFGSRRDSYAYISNNRGKVVKEFYYESAMPGRAIRDIRDYFKQTFKKGGQI